MNQVVWTESKCFQLIHEFKKRPILWYKRHPLFYKRGIKIVAWDEIANALDISPDACRQKMVIILSSFRREKAKLLHASKRKDLNAPFNSTWFAFDALSFLLDKGRERPRRPMEILDDCDCSEKSIDGDRLHASEQLPVQDVQDIQKEIEATLENDEYTRPRKRSAVSERISVKDDTFLKGIPALESQQHPSTSRYTDEINNFSRFIASKMMKYGERTKNAVQQEICDIIFKADQRCFEQKSNETSARSDHLYHRNSATEQLPSSSDFFIKMYDSDSD